MKRLNTETLVVEQLREDVRRGILKPGTTLLQNELADRFNVSRVPIRDALKVLEAEGIITLLPNRTAIVTLLAVEDIEEIFGVRRLLECDLIRRSTELVNLESYKVVEKISRQLDVVRTGTQFATLDRELHAALYADAKRSRQAAIVSGLGQQVARFYGSSLDLLGYHGDCQGGHREIVAAYLRRDAEGAAVSLAKHLRMAERKILDHMMELQE